jgi:hypothetical protein
MGVTYINYRALNKFTHEERETEFKTLLKEKVKDPDVRIFLEFS